MCCLWCLRRWDSRLPAILLSRFWRIPYVFDVEDLQPDSAADLGMLPGPAVKLLYGLEGMAYRHARLVTTLTATMRERIAAKGVPRDKIALLEPRMDESLSGITAEEGRVFRARYAIDGKFLVTYSGNIGVKQKLDVVIEAAALHRSDDSILFLIVGDGADARGSSGRASELGLSNVRFLPLLDESDFRGLLSASNVCLVTQQKAASEIAFPSKVVTYLAAGCPVIASVSSESEVARDRQRIRRGNGSRGRRRCGTSRSDSGIAKDRFAGIGQERPRIRLQAVVGGARAWKFGAQPERRGIPNGSAGSRGDIAMRVARIKHKLPVLIDMDCHGLDGRALCTGAVCIGSAGADCIGTAEEGEGQLPTPARRPPRARASQPRCPVWRPSGRRELEASGLLNVNLGDK